jgi:hypothetical protein
MRLAIAARVLGAVIPCERVGGWPAISARPWPENSQVGRYGADHLASRCQARVRSLRAIAMVAIFFPRRLAMAA